MQIKYPESWGLPAVYKTLLEPDYEPLSNDQIRATCSQDGPTIVQALDRAKSAIASGICGDSDTLVAMEIIGLRNPAIGLKVRLMLAEQLRDTCRNLEEQHADKQVT